MKSSTRFRRVLASVTSVAVAATIATAPVTGAQPNAPVTDLILGVGADETQANLAWFTDHEGQEYVQIAPTSAVTDGAFPAEEAETFEAQSAANSEGAFHAAATVTGLAENTGYVYRVGSDEAGWSEPQEFSTESFGDDWNFTFFGDPQVGSSGDVEGDAAGWYAATDAVAERHADTSLLISGGDQVERAGSTEEYTAFLANDDIRQVPTAVATGNHDTNSVLYDEHYNLPNEENRDYFYEHNNALFITLDSNQSSPEDIERHEQFLRDTVAAHGADKDWIVATYHHAPFSQANHLDDGNVIALREALAPVFSELGVDAVLGGHDHIYTRTHLMEGTTPVEPETAPVSGDVLEPEDNQVLYLTANSSSASKFYDFYGFDGEEYRGYPEITPEEAEAQSLTQPSTAVWNQDYTPDYTNVEVSDDTLTFTTYNVDNGEVVDQVTLSTGGDETGDDETGTSSDNLSSGSSKLFNGSSGLSS